MVKHRIIIEVKENDDQVHVTGPLNNKNLCIAMLEEAIDVVKKCGKKPIISIPTIKDLKKLNGNNV
jgi:hypothetical protein